ncbi:MAG: DUF1295 domain-containing protein [Polyangiaceae bacterium]
MSTLGRARGWVAVAYAVAIAAALVSLRFAPVLAPFWRVALADAIGTVVIFAFSVAFANSSFYDPYWSVAPPLMGLAWLMGAEAGVPLPRQVLALALTSWWAVRLTYNWGRHWRGLDHEDWRYVDIREKTGAAYWLVSFLGIHAFPTVQVLAGCAGLYAAMTGRGPLGLLDGLAAVVTAGAIVIEMVADRQLHDFVVANRDPDAIMDRGLWAWSRHPNYFGEVAFWWGLAAFGVAAVGPAWWIFMGPTAITAMFLFISIPLIDGRMLRKRPHYAEHIRRRSRLVPLPPRAE